ncbi:hypothetical protein, partial [Escherichia coli]|uniref:hypothetical protein n=1 Tax=Escherichia coli TaxID=562 RepID=UPI00195456F8
QRGFASVLQLGLPMKVPIKAPSLAGDGPSKHAGTRRTRYAAAKQLRGAFFSRPGCIPASYN